MARRTEVPPLTASVVDDQQLHLGRRRDWMAQRAQTPAHAAPMSVYEVHLGSWRQGLSLPRAGRPARRVRQLARLHARRAAAGRRAPVRRLLGLPGDRLLRADGALRHARRVPLPRRPAAPGRHRRHRRLGARALPEGRVGARPLRRHAALRARRPAGAASRWTGAPTSSTSAAARCATSSSPTRRTGSRSSTSTACGSTPSPRCSTSTTPARRGSGRRTSTAAARTSRRSRSCRR